MATMTRREHLQGLLGVAASVARPLEGVAGQDAAGGPGDVRAESGDAPTRAITENKAPKIATVPASPNATDNETIATIAISSTAPSIE